MLGPADVVKDSEKRERYQFYGEHQDVICQRLSQEVSKLNQELGPRGFQPVGVAFNPEANPSTVNAFIQQFGVNFPIGMAKVDTVLGYLGVSVMDRWVYPEVVIIDRKGMVRAQSPPQGDAKLQDPAQLRVLLDGLLKEK